MRGVGPGLVIDARPGKDRGAAATRRQSPDRSNQWSGLGPCDARAMTTRVEPWGTARLVRRTSDKAGGRHVAGCGAPTVWWLSAAATARRRSLVARTTVATARASARIGGCRSRDGSEDQSCGCHDDRDSAHHSFPPSRSSVFSCPHEHTLWPIRTALFSRSDLVASRNARTFPRTPERAELGGVRTDPRRGWYRSGDGGVGWNSTSTRAWTRSVCGR